MRYSAVGVAAFLAAGVTFFSGFGLGTLLLPLFSVYLPTEAAVASTAVVHFLNSGLKTGLLRRHINRRVVARFGLPALVAAPVGALTLSVLSDLDPLHRYTLGGREHSLAPVNLVIAFLLVALGLQEALSRPVIRPRERYLPLGGVASGLIGGLSGLQGALRSAFLVQLGLRPETFIATAAAIALMVDLGRLVVYATQGALSVPPDLVGLLVASIAGASAGTLLGNRLLERVTVRFMQLLVGALLVASAVALGLGLT